ncbi:MAG: nicotinate-nucleotide adenylyltransferase [Christensenellales bacterium]
MAVYAIMGGTFDPIHAGHIAVARAVYEEFRPERVLFVPDGDPPHKICGASAEDRLRMIEIALRGETGIVPCDMEVRRAGTTYTVDTLTQLRREHPRDAFYYIVGADTLRVIETWKNFPRISEILGGLFVVPRPGEENVQSMADALLKKYTLDIRFVDMESVDISSTDIRMRVARDMDIAGMVPLGVAEYIASKRLYRDPTIEALRGLLSRDRFRHTIGVEREAVRMARIFGVDEEKASLAALLHDCAKCMPEKEMRETIGRNLEVLIEPYETAPQLLHAIAGTALAYERFGIRDKEILSAIRWHTTGCEAMSMLDKIVYLADAIEPNRSPFPRLRKIRRLSETDLDAAVIECAKCTREYVASKGQTFNGRTNAMLRALKGAYKN